MAVVDILNDTGDKISQIDLPDGIFNIDVKSSILHEVVVMQMAARRSGSASVKHRSDVRGSTRKLFRQKGTGRARGGDKKSPLLKGGGVVFGPDPRSYGYKVPKKVRKKALKMALSSKYQENKLFILDKIALEEIKTKELLKTLRALKIDNALILTDQEHEALELSSRNLPNVKVLNVQGLNVYDILKYRNLVLLESSVKGIEGRLQS
ncbi:MAG: 50S ribosomal protein L4 [Desulfobacterales bacterium]|nr:50S ribosomal protein L4 [Desulfobacterales bacterium]